MLVEVLSAGEEDLMEAVTDDGNEVSFVLLASLSPAVALAAFKPRPKLSFLPFQAMMNYNMCVALVFGSAKLDTRCKNEDVICVGISSPYGLS